MSVAAILRELRSRDIRVWTDGDQLRCTAPAGLLTPALRDELRREKGAIVEFLRSAGALARQERAIVPLQPKGGRIPVFAVPGHNGNVFSLRLLAQELGDDQPFYGLQPPGVDGEGEPLTRIEELAAHFATQIRAFHPDGPRIIIGHCAGGATALELARQLAEEGTPVTLLALFGSAHPTWFRPVPQFLWRLGQQTEWLGHHIRTLASLSNRERGRYLTAKLAERWRQRTARPGPAAEAAPDPVMVHRARVERATRQALRRYTPRPYAGRVALFFPNREWMQPGHTMRRWNAVMPDVEEYCGPEGCQGEVMLHEPNVKMIAGQFQECLRTL